MRRPGLSELNAVVAVATHRSFRAAAAELGMSPSALSHSIATLEERIGVRLFSRTTRSVAPSQAGEQFLARIRPALREISEALDVASELSETLKGTLRINASEVSARYIVMPLVLELKKRHPELHVDLVTQERMVDIVAEGFDAGVRLAEAVPQDMVAVPMSPDLRLAIVGSPRYFRKHPRPTSPGDLLAHDCIRRRMASGAIYRWELEKRGEEIRMDVDGPLTLDRDDLMVEAALKGLGLAYTTEWQVEAHLAAKRLVRVLEDWTPPFPGLRLYYPSHRHVPAGLKAFIALVREANARLRRG